MVNIHNSRTIRMIRAREIYRHVELIVLSLVGSSKVVNYEPSSVSFAFQS